MSHSEAPITITRLTQTTSHTLADLNILLPQLNPELPPLTPASLKAILASPTQIFTAAHNGHIVGLALLIITYQFSGTKAWIEDVVVSNDYRGQGIARNLLQTAIDAAWNAEAKSINLTSNPARQAARSLYRSLDFELRDTNLFRLPNPAYQKK
jgi:ribosomal protein S18 acetylase RimI-like enzyme